LVGVGVESWVQIKVLHRLRRRRIGRIDSELNAVDWFVTSWLVDDNRDRKVWLRRPRPEPELEGDHEDGNHQADHSGDADRDEQQVVIEIVAQCVLDGRQIERRQWTAIYQLDEGLEGLQFLDQIGAIVGVRAERTGRTESL